MRCRDARGGRACRRALDDSQRSRPRPVRPDLDRRRPGPVRRHLPALRWRSAAGRSEIVARHPDLFDPQDVERLRLEQILARLAAQRYPGMESDKALVRMGRDQLWNDVSEQPLDYAGFVATKVGAIWSHGPRDVMRRPALGGPALGARRLRPARAGRPGKAAPLGSPPARHGLRLDHRDLRPPGRLSAARAGDDAARRPAGGRGAVACRDSLIRHGIAGRTSSRAS